MSATRAIPLFFLVMVIAVPTLGAIAGYPPTWTVYGIVAAYILFLMSLYLLP